LKRKIEFEKQQKQKMEKKNDENKANDADKNGEDYKLIELNDNTRGEGIMFEMHQSIEVRGSKVEGRGLYTTSFLPKGTVVWEANESDDGMFIEYEENMVDSLDENTKRLVSYYYEMNSKMKYRGGKVMEFIERDGSHFYNHSCNPNTWFIDDNKIAALRDLSPGEELTYDYATCKPLFTKGFNCNCGASKCRGKISQDDYKLADIQNRLGNHFVSHWLKLTNKQ